MVIVSFLLAYLIGAIPFSILIGKVFYDKDVRKEGSGNAGATNTFRVLGATAGIVVLILDIAKGVAAVLISKFIGNENFSADQFLYFQIGLGIMAGLGHIFPVYLRFKGGKGVATFFGVVLYLFPLAALVCAVIFFLTFFLTNYVSLGSILSSVAFTVSIFIWYLQSDQQMLLIVFAVVVPCIIMYTHRKNISRLLHGTESKIFLTEKKESS